MRNRVLEIIHSVVSYKYFPILLLLLVNFIVGISIGRDYGISWDEPRRYQVGEKTVATYLGESKYPIGLFYLMVSKLGSDAIHAVWRDWTPFEAWHLMNFLYYQLGLFFLYLIYLRVAGKWIAFGGTLLFATQPLIWGHAFINPKDIPFMTFFLGSVAFGLRMVDVFAGRHYPGLDQPAEPSPRESRLITHLTQEWRGWGRKKRIVTAWFLGLSLGALALLILATPLIHWLIKTLVHQAYTAEPTTFLGGIFSRLAENVNNVPVEHYIQKAFSLYTKTLLTCAVVTVTTILLAALLLFSQTRRWLRQMQAMPAGKLFIACFKEPWVWYSGILIGLCTSVRTLGPAAGLLVGTYFLLKAGRKAIPIMGACFVVAALVAYLATPNLWTDPFGSYQRSISTASNFPWEGMVMFNGIDYLPEDLPVSFLPVLLSLQFTETAMLMFIIGMVGAIIGFLNKTIEREMLIMAGLWFLAPLIATIAMHSTMYDNFRHILFIVPAIFLFACLGLQAVIKRINNIPLAGLITLLIILPGLYWNIKLHPYQYTYYNQITGGVEGAFRKYELDYWAISYKEASDFINQVAPTNATIFVWGPVKIVENYARGDLRVEGTLDRKKMDEFNPDYAIVSTRHNKDLTVFSNSEPIFWVERAGAKYTVVKKINPAYPPTP